MTKPKLRSLPGRLGLKSLPDRLGLVFLLAFSLAACAGGQNTAEGEGNVEGKAPPPEESAEPESTPGPEVRLEEVAGDAESTEDAGGGEPAEGEQAARGGSEDGDAGADDEPTVPEGAEVVSRADVIKLMQRGPAYILQSVRVEPYRNDGTFRGFEIVAVSRGAKDVLEPQMQLGDVVVSINDVRIQRPDDYLKVWKSLNTVDTVEIDYLRDDVDKTAVWVIRDKGDK